MRQATRRDGPARMTGRRGYLTSSRAPLSCPMAGSPPPQAASSSVVQALGIDRKSTRLNSSHANISYAVFCLKKQKTQYSIPFREKYSSRWHNLTHTSLAVQAS